MRRKSNRNTFKNIMSLTSKANVDSKIAQTELLYNYSFDYGVDFKSRIIRLVGEIDESKFEFIDAALSELESLSKATVTIRINSEGGSVYDALAIVGRIKKSYCNIITEGYGQVMSAATLILASGDKRKMSKFGFFMHHEASYALEGRHSDIKKEVDQTEREEKMWCNWMSEMTSETPEFWQKIGTGQNTYFNADELKALNVVDEVF